MATSMPIMNLAVFVGSDLNPNAPPFVPMAERIKKFNLETKLKEVLDEYDEFCNFEEIPVPNYYSIGYENQNFYYNMIDAYLDMVVEVQEKLLKCWGACQCINIEDSLRSRGENIVKKILMEKEMGEEIAMMRATR